MHHGHLQGGIFQIVGDLFLHRKIGIQNALFAGLYFCKSIRHQIQKQLFNLMDAQKTRGMELEKEINMTNSRYLADDTAVIHKKPTPVTIVKVDYPMRSAAKITEAYFTICKSRKFISDLRRIRKEFQGRPTPVSHLERLSDALGGKVQLYAKREDLNHSGAHKLNHCMGEALLAKYMGKKKVIAETGAGQHGVALATAAAYFGLQCDIYMGAVDIKKQAPNVARMKILGANVIEVTEGLQTLKEAVDAAFNAYMNEYKDAIYCIGSVLGQHPFPLMVRDFQSIIGVEAREQFIGMTGELPDAVVACVGGGDGAGIVHDGLASFLIDLILFGGGRICGGILALLVAANDRQKHRCTQQDRHKTLHCKCSPLLLAYKGIIAYFFPFVKKRRKNHFTLWW